MNLDQFGSLIEGNQIDVSLPELAHPTFSKDEARLALRNGASAALCRGPSMGFPVHNCHVEIRVTQYDGSTTLTTLAAGARVLTNKLLASMDVGLQEPIMLVDIAVDESHLGPVMNDVTGNRGGQVVSLEDVETTIVSGVTYYRPSDAVQKPSQGASNRVIKAKVPLREMIGYNSALRALTSGRGTFVMALDAFETMTPYAMKQLKKGL
ncbi:hypothetical protein MRB53_039332 [Persea americana]|nr:hypothetical protein MRB53_039332 [Persea americana]